MSLFISRSLLQSRIPGRRSLSFSARSSEKFIKTSTYTTVLAFSAGIFAVYYFDARSALHRYVLTPALRNLFDPETGHKLAVKALKTGLSPKDPVADDPRLKSEVRYHSVNIRCIQSSFRSSSGVKTCPIRLVLQQVLTRTERPSMVWPILLEENIIEASHYITGLYGLGFSWVEIGSITPKPQVCIGLTSVPRPTFVSAWQPSSPRLSNA